MFWNKNDKETASINKNKEIKSTVEDKYIWVEGYKGTDENMICQGQYPSYSLIKVISYRTEYELNKQFDLDDEPETCANGFHFCLNLKDVLGYYKFNFKNRFFKVKAYVKESDYERAKNSEDTKIAAKSIILTEEIIVDYESVFESGCLTYWSGDDKYEMSKEEFEDVVVKHTYKTVEEMCEDKFKERMIKCGYSETFTFVLSNKYSSDICKLMCTLEKAKAFADEKVSKDMAVYLLLN